MADRKQPKSNIIFCGSPGSGKTTQCLKLLEEFNLQYLSTGALLRQAITDQTDLGKQAKCYVDRGDLVPDELVLSLVHSKLKECSTTSGWLLDGFPRTKTQAEGLRNFGKDFRPDVLLCLFVPDNVCLNRCMGRRLDPVTSKTYHIHKIPPKDPEVEARLTQRPDDTEANVKNRCWDYGDHIDDILDFYRSEKAGVFRVDGDHTVDEVYQKITNILKDVA